MKTVVRLVLLLVVLMLASCSTVPLRPLAPGEMRLLSVEMPSTVHDDMPYSVMVHFEADGKPDIKRACFRWLAEKRLSKAPSLYCYAVEAQSDEPPGSYCAHWLAEGPYAGMSPLFCVPVDQVIDEPSTQFIANIQTRNIELVYNSLECYAEYEVNGEVRETNRVRAKVRVER